MPLPPQHSADVLQKENDSSHNLFGDDERFRTLTAAQTVAADIPEASVTYEHRAHGEDLAVDPKKVRPVPMAAFVRKYIFQESAFMTAMRQVGVERKKNLKR